MVNENQKDSWELEHSEPHKGDTVLNSDELQSDVGKLNPNKPEDYSWAIEEDSIDADNITPEIPRELWNKFIWDAVRAAIPGSQTKDDVIRKVKLWNTHNNPQLPEADLVRKVLWALRVFDDSPFKRF